MKATHKMHPLTEAQRDFAEQNHNLVTEFLRIRRLDVDEYYGVVILRYLRAVQMYDERPDLREACAFKTVAFRGMRSALYNHFRDQKRPKRSAVVYSLDMPAVGNLTLFESTSSQLPPAFEYAEAREEWDNIRDAITPKQMQTLKLRAEGYTNREIGKVYHIAPGSVSGRMSRLRRKLRSAA